MSWLSCKKLDYIYYAIESVQKVSNLLYSYFSGKKYLSNISLSLDSHREHFAIKSILGESLNFVGTDVQHFVVSPDSCVDDEIPCVRTYFVAIDFKASTTGTFCQDVIFGFNDGPAVRRQLCVDVVLPEDLNRLEAAREYLLYLSQNSSNHQNTRIVPFNSPFVMERDPREDRLCEIYPKPELETFFLTHTTLTQTALDPKNYRRRLHELVTIEEMARREQIARYNEVTELRLSNSYILASDTDGSTVAKYAAPGELFAQVGCVVY